MLKVPLVCLLSRHSLAVPVVKEKIWKKCLKQRIINPLTSIAACKLGGKKPATISFQSRTSHSSSGDASNPAGEHLKPTNT